jgi:hypothetical protein
MTAVGWVDRPELPVFNHCLERTRVQQLRLFDDALHHFTAGLLQLRLYEADDGEVALDLDILPQIQSVCWHTERPQANLWDLGRLDSRLVAGNAVLVPQVDVHGRVDVSLEAPWHVMEAAVEFDDRRAHLADTGNHLDALGDLIPGRVVLVRLGILGGGNGMVFNDQRVQGENLGVRVQDVDGELAGDEARDGRDHGEGVFFPQHGGFLTVW